MKQKPTTLRLVTMPRTDEQPCFGTYTCSCAGCVREKNIRALNGVRPAKRQPWQAKRAA